MQPQRNWPLTGASGLPGIHSRPNGSAIQYECGHAPNLAMSLIFIRDSSSAFPCGLRCGHTTVLAARFRARVCRGDPQPDFPNRDLREGATGLSSDQRLVLRTANREYRLAIWPGTGGQLSDQTNFHKSAKLTDVVRSSVWTLIHPGSALAPAFVWQGLFPPMPSSKKATRHRFFPNFLYRVPPPACARLQSQPDRQSPSRA